MVGNICSQHSQGGWGRTYFPIFSLFYTSKRSKPSSMSSGVFLGVFRGLKEVIYLVRIPLAELCPHYPGGFITVRAERSCWGLDTLNFAPLSVMLLWDGSF